MMTQGCWKAFIVDFIIGAWKMCCIYAASMIDQDLENDIFFELYICS